MTYSTHQEAAKAHAAEFSAITVQAEDIQVEIAALEKEVDTLIMGPSDTTNEMVTNAKEDSAMVKRAKSRRSYRAAGKKIPESLQETVESVREFLKTADESVKEATDWKKVDEICCTIRILNIEAYSLYTVAQTHLQTSNKHINAAKYNDTGSAGYY